jgi:hypothetical protein
VPWSILRPNCRKLKNAGVFVQRSPNDALRVQKDFRTCSPPPPYLRQPFGTLCVNRLGLFPLPQTYVLNIDV